MLWMCCGTFFVLFSLLGQHSRDAHGSDKMRFAWQVQ